MDESENSKFKFKPLVLLYDRTIGHCLCPGTANIGDVSGLEKDTISRSADMLVMS